MCTHVGSAVKHDVLLIIQQKSKNKQLTQTMQNKGFVKVIAVLLTLICLFYLSFSVVTNYYEGKAE